MLLLLHIIESCAKAGRCHHCRNSPRGNLASRPSSTRRRTRCTVDFPLSHNLARPCLFFSMYCCVACRSVLPKQASPFDVSTVPASGCLLSAPFRCSSSLLPRVPFGNTFVCVCTLGSAQQTLHCSSYSRYSSNDRLGGEATSL